jgi:hypothetical protein
VPPSPPLCISLSKHGLLAVGLQGESARLALYSVNSRVYNDQPLEEISFTDFPNYLVVKRACSINKDELKCIKFSAEGDYLLTGGDATFGILPVYDKHIEPYFYGIKVLVRLIAVDPDERRVLAFPQMQAFVQFTKLTSVQKRLMFETLKYT